MEPATESALSSVYDACLFLVDEYLRKHGLNATRMALQKERMGWAPARVPSNKLREIIPPAAVASQPARPASAAVVPAPFEALVRTEAPRSTLEQIVEQLAMGAEDGRAVDASAACRGSDDEMDSQSAGPVVPNLSYASAEAEAQTGGEGATRRVVASGWASGDD